MTVDTLIYDIIEIGLKNNIISHECFTWLRGLSLLLPKKFLAQILLKKVVYHNLCSLKNGKPLILQLVKAEINEQTLKYFLSTLHIHGSMFDLWAMHKTNYITVQKSANLRKTFGT